MSFYVRAGEGYAATELTRGPWDENSQHAGPPCALLAGELDRTGQIEAARITRVTFEIVRPVPIATLTVAAGVVRPGRRVELVEGSLRHDGIDVILARAWRVRTEELELDTPQPEAEAIPGPEHATPRDFFDTGHETGYHSAMEVRFGHGSYLDTGPARAWMRMRVPLVEGEEPSPLDRVLVVADSGNGVSAPLDYSRWLFINTDLSVALRRLPVGEWVCLDAVTTADSSGIGLTDTLLRDERGAIGRATQSLLVARRD